MSPKTLRFACLGHRLDDQEATERFLREAKAVVAGPIGITARLCKYDRVASPKTSSRLRYRSCEQGRRSELEAVSLRVRHG